MALAVKILFVALMLEPTLVCVYGMIRKKRWFWSPASTRNTHPILSWRCSQNELFGKVFGDKGIVFFNILILIFTWIVGIFLILKGKWISF